MRDRSIDDPEAALRRALVEEYLWEHGLGVEDLASVDRDARQLLALEAAAYAALRLAERAFDPVIPASNGWRCVVIADRWGVTDAEVARRYPCDDFVAVPFFKRGAAPRELRNLREPVVGESLTLFVR